MFLYIIPYPMGMKKGLAIGLTALTLGGAINKSNAQGQFGGKDLIQQQLMHTLITQNDTDTYTITPQEIAKSEINNSTEIIDYISEFNKDFSKLYPKDVLSHKINLLIDTHPNFDSLPQAEQNKILMDTFPELMKDKKVEFWLTLALLGIAVTAGLGVIGYMTVSGIKATREDEKNSKKLSTQ